MHRKEKKELYCLFLLRSIQKLSHFRLNITDSINDRIQRITKIVQVEMYGRVPSGRHEKSTEHGSSIPTRNFPYLLQDPLSFDDLSTTSF